MNATPLALSESCQMQSSLLGSVYRYIRHAIFLVILQEEMLKIFAPENEETRLRKQCCLNVFFFFLCGNTQHLLQKQLFASEKTVSELFHKHFVYAANGSCASKWGNRETILAR